MQFHDSLNVISLARMVQDIMPMQQGEVMKNQKATLIVVLALLVALVFTATAIAQRVGGGKNGADVWVVMTYVPDNGYTTPVPLPVTFVKGGGVAFDFYQTPDRAMLLAEDLDILKQFHNGNLTGKTLSAKIAIEATSGATFNYFNYDGTGQLQYGWADEGGFVRLYFNKVNTLGCPTGWHPERPDCEAQYWWSNPVHVDLVDLAARGKKGLRLEVPLDPEFWSDRDGHMGTDVVTFPGNITVDHTEAFNEAVANVHKIGLSFGGNGWWAFGCGVNAPATATFILDKFEVKH
jgi:hypothetical protein